ncbi:MAG: Rpn family recombination-promoting nuclease/putative transposase [Caldilinea sp. CFX5]|nr:Rpn family recombination-promoting nuclease/putative transposase [Caldilinea sp. CFX5]
MSEKIINPHDAFFKQYMGHAVVAADFLHHHLPPAIAALLDLDQLRLEKDSFVDEALRSNFSDLLYRTVTKDRTPVAIALLLEHKSYVDQWVGFQVLKYIERYWEHELQESGKLSPVVPVVVYHGTETWTVATRFARKVEGLKDPAASLNQTVGRYTPDFEYHLVNLTQLSDAEIRGAVVTRLFMLVLKHIFEPGLGGRLDEILALAAEVINLSSGMAMVAALLRYIARSATGVEKETVAQKLLAVLPKEGGVLMQTMAEAWIEEGKVIGVKKGREDERIDLIIRLLRRRFQPSEETLQTLAQQLAQIQQEAILSQLVDLALDVLTLPDFMTKVQTLLPVTPTNSKA